jgi:hypothetical protein
VVIFKDENFAEGDWSSGLSSGKPGKKDPKNPVNPV